MSRWCSRCLGLLLLATALGATPAAAQTFSSGSTGADGAYSPASNTTLTLPASGIFHFTTITIPSGVTVTIARNAANTPAILLASGNVTISGTLIVTGGTGGVLGRPGAGGPGGFDGGPGGDGVTVATAGAGLGPGGGLAGTTCVGSGGSYGTAGTLPTANCSTPPTAAPTYGATALRPIVGGSGGSGGSASGVPGNAGGAGGGGGGALVIASSGTLTLNSTGQIVADGGAGSASVGSGYGGGGGSGGAIRLVATTLVSNGYLYARGGTFGQYGGGTGGLGRLRLEAYTLTVGGTRSPEATQGLPQSVFPAAGQPTLTITSVAGVTAPATPSGSFLTPPDIQVPPGTTNPMAVVLTATNVPLGTTILVTATPQSGAKTTATSAGLSGTLASSTATATLTISLTQTSVLTASATFPLVASAGEGPLYAEGLVPSLVEGEEVTHLRIAAAFGGRSTLTYVTRSGREIAVP